MKKQNKSLTNGITVGKIKLVFCEQLHYYCEMDETILRKCAIKFYKMIREVSGVLLFYDKSRMMIASVALKTFQTKFEKKFDWNLTCIGISKPCKSKSDCFGLVKRKLEKIFEIDSRSCISMIYQFHRCFYFGSRTCYEGEYNEILKKTPKNTQIIWGILGLKYVSVIF